MMNNWWRVRSIHNHDDISRHLSERFLLFSWNPSLILLVKFLIEFQYFLVVKRHDIVMIICEPFHMILYRIKISSYSFWMSLPKYLLFYISFDFIFFLYSCVGGYDDNDIIILLSFQWLSFKHFWATVFLSSRSS